MSMCDCNQGRLPCTCKPEIKISTGHPDAGRIYAKALARVTAERDALQADLDAKDQRVGELLEIARTLTVQLHEALGNTEYHEDCIRDLAALNPTPKPKDKNHE